MSSNKIHSKSGKDSGQGELTEAEINRLADIIYAREFKDGKGLVGLTEEERRKIMDSTPRAKRDGAYFKELDGMVRHTRERIAHEFPADWMPAGYWQEDGDLAEEPETEEKEISIRWYKRKVLRICAVAAVTLAVVFFGCRLAMGEYRKAVRMASAGQAFFCGRDSSMLLSDGTKVDLQGGSKLYAGTDFGDTARCVYIDGQGFMDVKRDTQRPYNVAMPHGLSLKVLGTAFNINAYSDNPLSEITVSRGCVTISNNRTGKEYGRFYKGDRFTYNHETGEAVRSRAAGDVARWMHPGSFALHGASVAEFRQGMFEMFGVDVTILDNAIPADAEIYSDVSPEKPTLETVLSQVCRVYSACSSRNGRKIIIYK